MLSTLCSSALTSKPQKQKTREKQKEKKHIEKKKKKKKKNTKIPDARDPPFSTEASRNLFFFFCFF